MSASLVLALSAALFAQSSEERPVFFEKLTSINVKSVVFRIPAGWVAQIKEGHARFDTPGGDAFLDIQVVELNPFESPHECLEEMIQKVSALEGWQRLAKGMDEYPAARWMETRPGNESDIPTAEEAERLALGKPVDMRMTEIVYMGCNGARKWVLRMSAKTREASKHGPTFRRVAESLRYEKHATLGQPKNPKPRRR